MRGVKAVAVSVDSHVALGVTYWRDSEDAEVSTRSCLAQQMVVTRKHHCDVRAHLVATELATVPYIKQTEH